ncbi:hypothetical protein AB0I55_05000 [Actinocatenispora sera]|uniref:hypothetical protein n=1 Tax=Actinocatenispora sera TaxID=390989 RepID=UPI0033CB7D70
MSVNFRTCPAGRVSGDGCAAERAGVRGGVLDRLPRGIQRERRDLVLVQIEQVSDAAVAAPAAGHFAGREGVHLPGTPGPHGRRDPRCYAPWV